MMRELVRELALALRERVAPQVGSHAARAHTGDAAGGDVTFAIDAAAEELLRSFLAERAPDVAFYSEDAGLVGARVVLCLGGRGALRRRRDDGRRERRMRGRDPVGTGLPGRARRRLDRGWPRAAVGEPAPRPDVLDLRLPRPAGAAADRGARR